MTAMIESFEGIAIVRQNERMNKRNETNFDLNFLLLNGLTSELLFNKTCTWLLITGV